ncbi:bark storage protein B isoform X1 [Beta vulgaris subsp. vulgaris]|uniref:bark storage protein B isoform X1 n=2 Tax=Beta vulgaris subsp. vulgaris TaxID=3555 RepID=UPI00203670E6|nr:bark storage protein B isoform X1 [Beta vulgaris subsp. vulgaris]
MCVVKAIIFFFLVIYAQHGAQGEIPKRTMHLINSANYKGPYIGVVIPNLFELNPLLQSPSFTSSRLTIDFAGRRFRFGTIAGKKVILVMTGLGMVNAGLTTQMLLSLFRVEGVVHYGIAGNTDPSLHVGDVAIPQYWAHLGLLNWQRNGDGPEDELALEAAGDYSRDYGNLRFGDYTSNISDNNVPNNLLNRIWYQAEEVFPVDGTPEERQHIFWVPVDPHYFNLAKRLKSLKLERCVNATTCLSTTPKVSTVLRGGSASIFVDNAAYRNFIYEQFKLSPVEMESAGVALICHQQRVPFITLRALSDLAGGGSVQSNEADTFLPVAATNSVIAVVEFIKLL